MMTTQLQSPPDLNSSEFMITEQTQYFYPETWNALINWQQAWYDYLVAQANFYQQAITNASTDLRSEIGTHINDLNQAAEQAQASIKQTKEQSIAEINQSKADVQGYFNTTVQQIEAQKADIAQHAAVITSGLAAVNLPVFTEIQAGSVMITDGAEYKVIRPIFRPPSF